MLRLRTFGTVLVESGGQPLGGMAGQRRVLALLSLLAVAREGGLSRDRVLGLLWPDVDPERARQALTQALYHARRAVNQPDLFFAGGDIRLNPAVITSDVGDFEAALARGELREAVDRFAGPFLEGFYVNGAPEFERWAATERARLNDRYARALETLATEAEAAGDYRIAVERRKQIAAIDPFNSRIAMDLVMAMAAAGDRAGALQHARVHETLLRKELDVEPAEAFTRLVGRLRDDPAWVPAEGASVERQPRSNGGQHPPAAMVDVSDASQTQSPHVARGQVSTQRRLAVALAIVAVALAAVVVDRAVGTSSREAVAGQAASDQILVAPFRVAGADPSLGYLREGLVDLLVTKLTDHDPDGAADPGAVMSAWRRARLVNRPDVPRADALRIARQLGAQRLIMGSVVGTPDRVVISASIVGVRQGEVRAQATVEGPSDSLTTLVDRLAARLVATEAGTAEQLASHTSTSLQALRAFLDGQAAYRGGSYRVAIQHFQRALTRDSTFAMAGLGLAQAAERIGAQEEMERGLAAAWTSRGELTERDRTYLDALAGPRYPARSSAREHFMAWERASAITPNRAEVWHELGERVFHDGRWLGVRDWQARAAKAFRRAAELDPSFVPPHQYLLQLAAVGRDISEARRTAALYLALDSAGDLSGFVRWRAAATLSDTAALRAIRREFNGMPSPSLRLIALSSLSDAVEIADAERALLALQRRAVREAERAEVLLGLHALAVNRGQPPLALARIDDAQDTEPARGLAPRLRILDALYGDGDTTAALVSVRQLELTSGAMRTGPAPADPESRADLCAVSQWHAWRGEMAAARRAIPALLDDRAPRGSDGPSVVCAALVDAVLAVRERRRSALLHVTTLDSLLSFGPPAGDTRTYATLAAGRLYDALGQRDRARAAVRRRPYMREWPRYLAAQLRLEGDLALSAGDTLAALGAYGPFLVLRAESAGALQADVARVQSRMNSVNAGRSILP